MNGVLQPLKLGAGLIASSQIAHIFAIFREAATLALEPHCWNLLILILLTHFITLSGKREALLSAVSGTGRPYSLPAVWAHMKTANWTPVVAQIKTELRYVKTANDWLLGPTGSETLLTQIFTETSFDVDSVSAKLQNVDPAQIAANLAQMFIGVGTAIGGSVVGLPPVYSNVFNQLSNDIAKHGGFPSDPTLAVGKVKGQLAVMYSAALDGNSDTHRQLVTDWSKLNAFAASIVGTAPTDDQQKVMRTAGEMSYAVWLWQGSLSDALAIVVPLIRNDFNGC